MMIKLKNLLFQFEFDEKNKNVAIFKDEIFI